MYKCRLDLTPLVRSALPAAQAEFLSYYVSVFEVNPRRENQNRNVTLISMDVLPGMRNADRLRQAAARGEAHTVYLFPYAILTPDLLSCVPALDFAANETQLTQSIRTDAPPPPIFNSYATEDVLACAQSGWRIAVFARCIHDLVASSDPSEHHIPNNVRSGVREQDQRRTREIQLGEAFLPAHVLAGSTVVRTISLGLSDNASRTGDGFTQRAILVYVESISVGATVQRGAVERWRTVHGGEAVRQPLATVAKQYRDVLEPELEQLYTDAFVMPFHHVRAKPYAQLEAEASSVWRRDGRLLPYQPDMAAHHVVNLRTYLSDTTPTLPIWCYSWPTAWLDATPLDADCVARKRGFARLTLRATCATYSVRPSEIVRVLAPYIRIADDHTQNINISASQFADMLACRELLAHFFTLPAFMGKYRSDFGFDGRGATLVPGESCDFNRIAGQTASDDCEGSEAVTREMVLLATELSRLPREPGSTRGAGGGGQDNDDGDDDASYDQAVYAIGQFVDRFYDYLSASGSTTAAYPGCDIHGDATNVDQDDAAALDVPASRAAQHRTVLRRLKYDSEAARGARVGFHQYAVLGAVTHLYQVVCEHDTLPAQRQHDAYHAALHEYYTRRGQRLRQVLGDRAPPSIVLECTFPVSPQFVGASVFLAPPAMKLNDAELRKMQQGVDPTLPIRTIDVVDDDDGAVFAMAVRADSLAAADARALKQQFEPAFAQRFPHVPLRVKDVHSLRRVGGHEQRAEVTTTTRDVLSVTRMLEDEERFCTVFYRHLSHTINVTFILNMLRGGQGALCETEVGALSHMTWVNGANNRFGVPLEHLILGTLSAAHPFGVATRHFGVFPFARSVSTHRGTLRAIDDAHRVLAPQKQLPPVNFGLAYLDDVTFPSVPSAVQAVPFFQRVMNTRVVLIDSEEPSQSAAVEYARDLLRRTLTRRADAASVQVFGCQLLPVFGDKLTILCTR